MNTQKDTNKTHKKTKHTTIKTTHEKHRKLNGTRNNIQIQQKTENDTYSNKKENMGTQNTWNTQDKENKKHKEKQKHHIQ